MSTAAVCPAEAETRSRHRFSLLADPAPDVLPRALAFFAKRCVTPCSVVARVEADTLRVAIETRDLDAEVADHVALCLAQIVGVREARLGR